MSWRLSKHQFLFNWILTIIGIGLLTVLSVAFPTSAANGETCYSVSGAGLSGVNGTYKPAGSVNNRTAFKHQEAEYYISYEAHGWGNEWDLTNSMGGGLDLYWAASSDQDPPQGMWNTGNDGVAPRAMVVSFDCSDQPETTAFDLIGGESLDGSTGTVGAFTPSSCYYGTLFISKISPPFYEKSNFHIHGSTLDVRIVDADGNELESYCGYYYVYFNLNAETLKLWNAGDLSVYEYGNKSWVRLSPYLVDAGEHGRLAIIVTRPGIFALANEK
jgi:hypothetical protein